MDRGEARVFEYETFGFISIDVEKELEEFKSNLLLKVYVEIEPILNAILTHKNLSDEQQTLILNDVRKNTNIYYYMGDKETFINLLHYLSSKPLKDLKELKTQITNNEYPKLFKIKAETLKNLASNNLREIYKLRYKSLLLRYIDHLIILYK